MNWFFSKKKTIDLKPKHRIKAGVWYQDYITLLTHIKKIGFTLLDTNKKHISIEELVKLANEKHAKENVFCIIKTQNPETHLLFTLFKAAKNYKEFTPYYNLSIAPLDPYIMRTCDKKKIDLSAYFELFLQIIEGKYIEFLETEGF